MSNVSCYKTYSRRIGERGSATSSAGPPGSLSPAKTAAGIADGAAKTRGQAVMAAAKSFFVGHG